MSEKWHIQRMRELEAMAPIKHTKKTDKFAQIPLWWAARASEEGGLAEVLVCVDLVHRAWLAKGKSFPMPNGKGVSPKIKYRVLRGLERAELIAVDWRPRKSPQITMAPPIKSRSV
jgi:hypothetical protein